MKKITFLILIFVTVFQSCKKTESPDYYIIDGKIENYKGKIYLSRVVHSNYYLSNFEMDSVGILDTTTIANGKFEFRLSKKNDTPLPFYIQTEESRTNKFILTPNNQQIIIDSFYFNVTPKIISKNSTIENEELIFDQRNAPALEEFKSEFKKIRDDDFPKDSIEKFAISARKKLTFERNLILTDFTREYPNSYVSFWQIVVSMQYNGFSKELEDAYNYLSPSIKNTEVAKIFENNMMIAKVLTPGANFPELKLKNKELKDLVFNANENTNAKYILVDFWFSYCGPCIAQFPKLLELHKKYSPDKLKIISISTDKTKNISNWFKMMEKHNISWVNYLDETGVETSPLGINKFPTNYLLNNDGIIIKKDISLVDLKVLLENVD